MDAHANSKPGMPQHVFTPKPISSMVTLSRVLQKHRCLEDYPEAVARRYPFRLSSYFAGLIQSPGDPIWRQAIPDARELEDTSGFEDPLSEEQLSPAPNLVHRYPNRVLWLISQECALHCRFCTRKRRWNAPQPMTEEHLREGLGYIRAHHEVKDVLLSGGDPLMLSPQRLESILAALRGIPHVEIIRIGTRVPVALPGRVTPELALMLSKFHPLFINLHINHPLEITPESSRAFRLLADAGIPLGSQTVLLRDINDKPEILGDLFQRLLMMRVRPYYLMQMDLTQGTAHFRTRISTGLEVLHALRNRISGLAMPHLVIDLPGGRGKVPLLPSSIEKITSEHLIVRNYQGIQCEYPLLQGESEKLSQWIRP